MEYLKPERINELTNNLWHLLAVERSDVEGVIEYIDNEGIKDVGQLYAMWLSVSIGLFNLMSPVEYGFRLSPEQLANIHRLVHRMGSSWMDLHGGNGIECVQRAFTHMSEGNTEEVGVEFVRAWATTPITAAQMLVLSSAVVRAAARFHGVPVHALATRASELRTYLADIRASVQDTDWCGECAPKAMALLEMTDDRASRPVPDSSDMSFLEGIDLTREAQTDE